ncbi:hypothetical protein AAG565_07925 [Fontimonas sp. SYSU GA230001]
MTRGAALLAAALQDAAARAWAALLTAQLRGDGFAVAAVENAP